MATAAKLLLLYDHCCYITTVVSMATVCGYCLVTTVVVAATVVSGGLVEEVALCGDGAQGQRPHAGEPHLHEPGQCYRSYQSRHAHHSDGFHSEALAGDTIS